MAADKLKAQIASMASHVLFSYNGVDCGVDPLAPDHFDMWYGDESITVDSIDAVMSTPFFEGRTLSDIAQDITNLEW